MTANYQKYSVGQLKQLARNIRIKNEGLKARMEALKNQQDIEFGFKEINDKVWPFWFSTPFDEVAANNVTVSNISITNEAGFTIVGINKVVFKDDGGTPVYIDPDDESANGLLNNIDFTISDSSSSRRWMQSPVHLNIIGSGNKPWYLDNPFFLAPNHNLSVEFNNATADVFRISMVFFGYRFKDPLIDKLSTFVTE